MLIASDDPDAASKPWWDVPVEPGRLFFVGDPKQSIYRFRRADIGMFLRARDVVGGRVEQLTANFRTVEPILGWVNHTFGQLIRADGSPSRPTCRSTRYGPPARRDRRSRSSDVRRTRRLAGRRPAGG